MGKGFKDSNGKFRPTGNSNKLSSDEFKEIVDKAKKHDFNKNRLNVEFYEQDFNKPEWKRVTSLSFGSLQDVIDHYKLMIKHPSSIEREGSFVITDEFPLERRQSAPLKYVTKARDAGFQLDQFGWIEQNAYNDKLLKKYDQNYTLTKNLGVINHD